MAMTWSQRSRTYILKIIFKRVTIAAISCFDRGCLYLARLLLMVCRLQQRLQIIAMTDVLFCTIIANMTFESKFKVKYTLIQAVWLQIPTYDTF